MSHVLGCSLLNLMGQHVHQNMAMESEGYISLIQGAFTRHVQYLTGQHFNTAFSPVF